MFEPLNGKVHTIKVFYYASAQRTVAGGILFLSCSSVLACVCACIRVCIPKHC